MAKLMRVLPNANRALRVPDRKKLETSKPLGINVTSKGQGYYPAPESHR